ncbi:hypothetical protein MKW98_031448 [Papaver atlanticum]|uniref:Mechanosensitive ion channel MscS domain-containing protein n=1 Tax=Papaver atlanticum TaxID=357466 RepID=A0AAD4X800_9MAGN|nr:hypothetical protein MKW98_031448 [Papaver atlanticum]
MSNSVDFRGITTGFKNFQFLKTSTRRMPLIHEIGLATSTKKPNLTLKNVKKFYVSCSSNSPKPGDFPLQNWWLQKNAEVAYEFAKSLIVWILSSFYKKREFEMNLPFKVGDLVDVKASGDSVFGVVEKVGEKLTCIKGFDNIPRYLPNGDFETKNVKNLTFVTVHEECPVKCCAGKEKKVDSKAQVDSLLALWGLTLSFQISCKASWHVKKMLEDIHAEITGDSYVKAHLRVSVSIDKYISDKQKFEILVACFVDAKNCSQEYLKIKSHLQMKLADRVGKYENPTMKITETDT